MHAFVKPGNSKDDVFIRLPTYALAQPLTDKIEWLMDHRIGLGFVNNNIVGVYLSNADAMIFKLKFGP